MQVHNIDTFVAPGMKGNPTAVVILDNGLTESSMREIATEMNLPVTAFLQPSYSEEPHQIRYASITGEIPACGHATLAAAGLVLTQRNSSSETFQTGTGLIINSSREGDSIFMAYPRYEAKATEINKATMIALGLEYFTNGYFCQELETLFIELNDAVLLRGLDPDFKALTQSSNYIKEVVVMAISDNPSCDFQLRSFCPWIGIDEDPVTGSVHSFLAPLWADRLQKNKLIAWQTSKQGGEVQLEVMKERVQIGGKMRLIH